MKKDDGKSFITVFIPVFQRTVRKTAPQPRRDTQRKCASVLLEFISDKIVQIAKSFSRYISKPVFKEHFNMVGELKKKRKS